MAVQRLPRRPIHAGGDFFGIEIGREPVIHVSSIEMQEKLRDANQNNANRAEKQKTV